MAEDQATLDLDHQITAHQSEAQADRDRVREEYRARLAEKLKDPEFRKIEGFPIGTDEAILALSDPPYYTACPNPFIEEWLKENGKPYDAATDTYHREPFAADVSEGKNDPIYNAHSYHTKVPHKAIMRYILHYTEPGDVVYDGFCGTGMTGVAAQMCGNKAQVESLGYRVQADGTILDETGEPFSKLGARKAILNDLSPAATFIAYNYNTPVDAVAFERDAKRIMAEVEEECGWIYSTLHDATPEETERVSEAVRACTTAEELRALYAELKSGKSPLRGPISRMQVGRINYTVWSDIFLCPGCGAEIVFWDAAVDIQNKELLEVFRCAYCRAEVTKRRCERAFANYIDSVSGEMTRQFKQVPVLINFSVGKNRYERSPTSTDIALIERIWNLPPQSWLPVDILPFMHQTHQRNRFDLLGITHVHHFYTFRNLMAFGKLWEASENPTMRVALTGGLSVGLKMSRFRVPLWFSKTSGPMKGMTSGTLYIPSLSGEQNWFSIFAERIAAIIRQLHVASDNLQHGGTLAFTGSTSSQQIPEECLDYIFTDPPFGGNLMYSELNYANESWLRTRTAILHEAVTNDAQSKGLFEYHCLMKCCFLSFFKALKPGRWITVEFHNSANAVWNSIQEGLESTGFIVADVRTLDKKQHGFNGINAAGAVKQDLVISCYKPRSEFETRFRDLQGKPESAVEFVRQHLAMLPVTPLSKGGKIEPVAERNRFLLFDRMIAYHLQKGAPIPLDAAPFYKMLEEQFTCRDEMYFLPEQAARYDALKMRGVETEQLSIFVQDEKTAVQWVRTALSETPQTLGELTPTFMQELRDWPAHEPRPELKDLLREYFIQGEGGVWRVPNPDDEKDIEELRKNALLRLFRDYTKAKGPLKFFRKEAIIQGFTTCYETNQYSVIVSVCEKIPDKIRDEIQEFVMFYDIAKSLAPPEITQTEFVLE